MSYNHDKPCTRELLTAGLDFGAFWYVHRLVLMTTSACRETCVSQRSASHHREDWVDAKSWVESGFWFTMG
jgi:hypothetical protein